MLLWLILTLAGVFGVIAMAGAPALFFNVPSVIIVVGMICGLSLASYGFKDAFHALSMFRLLVTPRVSDATVRDVQVLRSAIAQSYVAGVVGTLIGAIQMLATLDDPSSIGACMAVALLTIFYAPIFGELLLRPLATRVEACLTEEN